MISNNKIKKILLVDDEPDVTYTIKNILEDNGFQVDAFNDPNFALKSYISHYYNLVILDIKMPKMDGFELYTKIREKDPKVKICFLTASEMYYEKFRKTRSEIGRINGEDSFIQKPIKNEDLIKKLTNIMNINII
ncbi:MAG: response regulator [Nitrososphaeraceae archaeon]